jgi:hypothetical protein
VDESFSIERIQIRIAEVRGMLQELKKIKLFPENCWDISTAVEKGTVTFDNNARTYGTVATVTCNSGYTISGSSTLTCNAGIWDQDLPTCNCDQGICTGKNCSITGCWGGTLLYRNYEDQPVISLYNFFLVLRLKKSRIKCMDDFHNFTLNITLFMVYHSAN